MIVAGVDCRRCRGSGEIAYRNTFPMTETGPGPVPEDARGVTARKCPACNGTGVVDIDIAQDAEW